MHGARRCSCASCCRRGTTRTTRLALPLALGKDIGGDPVIADLARMPHLLIGGTTGSGKSVAVNTMILSLLYRLPPDKCRFIMIDPKMLELSVYQDIPHLLTPVVTEPRKAIVALKWVVREMEDRYRAMSAQGVRNIAGYNEKLGEARKKGVLLTRKVQTGIDPETRRPTFEDEEIDLNPLPFIVVIIDEMADLMLVAGKEIEARRAAPGADGARRRHPCRDGDAAAVGRRHHRHHQGQLPDPHLLPGDVEDRQPHHPGRAGRRAAARPGRHALHGGRRQDRARARAVRVATARSRRSCATCGRRACRPISNRSPTIPTAKKAAARRARGEERESDQLYDQAIALVARERKCSTSFIQRYLQIGYNRAARIVERMEREGVVTAANHVGKREVLARDIDNRER